MLFNSLEFLIFFIVVVTLYFLIPHKYRWILLLTASYLFYMSWKVEYIVLILFATIINYWMSIKLYETSNLKKKKIYLYISLISSLSVLFIFKYFNFFMQSITDLNKILNINIESTTLSLLLPVGISFYTFQTLSYTIDVYRGKIKPERHFGIFALFVTFFPQLVAGPIERSENLLPQFYEKHDFDYDRVINGFILMLIGFTKKVVVADRIAVVVNQVYNNPNDYYGITIIIATVLFAVQIYYDFSGYSDIAIGVSQIMGFSLMDNFKKPYFAKSVSEFWKRWHISLSSWLKDYVYIPLGGNRVVKWRHYYNLIVTFFLSGLWHGAAWTFVIWGLLHGGYLVVSIITKNIRDKVMAPIRKLKKLNSLIQMVITFILVDFAWIFFRANSLGDSVTIIKNMTHLSLNLEPVYKLFWTVHFTKVDLVIFILCTIIIEGIKIPRNKRYIDFNRYKIPVYVRWGLYFAALFVIIVLGAYTKANEFIYFQF
ncbi:MBOAT family O-acyltransferase [Abyssisolibacter fermentans]|uniref:MBOAT family O-acyltransferase n=1 Tax=Abyssisolibacter fermentans TaxID=1766203 RepID=UPI000832EDD5|nr:MBOAT family O-acyltransferase [Abyssisolibacter fermentans]